MAIHEKTIYGKELFEKRKQLNSELLRYKTPIEDDLSFLPIIMNIIYTNITIENRESYLRYYFVIIVVTLYSPRCFVGQIMSHGLRKSMSNALGITSPTTVSQVFTTANIWLSCDKEFRGTVEKLYEIVIQKLHK